MKEPRHLYFENILTKEECFSLENSFSRVIYDLKNMNLSFPGLTFDPNISKAVGILNPYKNLNVNGNAVISRLTELMRKSYPEDELVYSHTFLRKYIDDCALPIHSDRPGIDITLSVNVAGLQDWEIFISNVASKHEIWGKGNSDTIKYENQNLKFRQDFVKYKTPIGCGVSCYAGIFPHWRERLICNEDEYMMQIFFHWKFVSSPWMITS